ncbi:transposase [Anoxybacter fermentans]
MLNYFKIKITNGCAEGINNRIKLIKWLEYDVLNVMNLRRRVFNTMLNY